MKLEMEIMKQIDHPNLVRLHEIIDDPKNKKIYLVMDYMDKGAIGQSDGFQKKLIPKA